MGRQLTITIRVDEDVAARLEEAVKRSGAPVDEVATDALRRGLPEPDKPVKRKPYEFPPGTTVELKPGINIDCIPDLLEQIEDSWRK
ncbi:MAG TPA: hypothetical protein VJ276_11740 [Thermoanaerobaculia bacterium]|nr:hypothetical protein [Thermoanaerobaculia bacterium]